MTNSISFIDNLDIDTKNVKELNDSFSNTLTTPTSSSLLEALADAIDEKPLNSFQRHITQNNIANNKLPPLSSLTSIQNISNSVLSQNIMDKHKYEDYITAYAAYCQAYQYSVTVAYQQQRAFANAFSRYHPIQVNSTNHKILYHPIALRTQDDPSFTGRYGHDYLVKSYHQTKPLMNNQNVKIVSNGNRSNDDVHANNNNNMSDSENADDQCNSINDKDSPDSINMIPDESMTMKSNQDIQRKTHKLAERKRRNEMKKLFEQLKTLLFNSTQPERYKLSKWNILSQTINTIDSLILKKALLMSKKNYLIPRILKLQSIDNTSLIIDENISSIHSEDIQCLEMRNNKKLSYLDVLAAVVNSQ